MTNPALLVIDVQTGIEQSEYWGGNRNNPNAEDNIAALLRHWRSSGRAVFIVQHHSNNPVSPFFPEKEGNHLKAFAEPLPGETLLTKATTNAFIGTPLIHLLAEKKIDTIVVAGFVTNNSVEATVRFAGESAFRVVVVSDATATFDKKGLDGTVYPAELVHQISLANLQGEYATVKSTRQILEDLSGFVST
jgi:nicotinamidase-related amidase